MLSRPVHTLTCRSVPARPAYLLRLCREWVSSDDGEGVATQLIAVLVAEHLSTTGEHLLHCLKTFGCCCC